MSKVSSTKVQLKAIGDAIKSNKLDDAIGLAESLIEREPKNYQARIFLGFALEKKNHLDAAEKTYREAIRLRPHDPQAFQGLIKVYEKQGEKNLDSYQEVVEFIAQVFSTTNEFHKAQDAVEKFIDFSRVQGTQEQYVHALSLILPESAVYSALEGRVAHPSRTWETISQLREASEKKQINTLIGERRTRIGARLQDVTVEVKREVYDKSQLEHSYLQFIQWTSDDEKRRLYEEKLLQYCYDRLVVTPPGPLKDSRRDVVVKLAQDMVIIKHPFRLAWEVTIDWKNYKSISDWDVNILREYCSFFPESDLYKVITGFLTSAVSPFPKVPEADATVTAEKGSAEESSDDSDGGAPTAVVPFTDEDRLVMMTDGISGTESLFGYRLMGEYYQYLQEHESTAELMRKATGYLGVERVRSGFKFENVADAYSLYLASALVYYQSPRHHEEARVLFNNILDRDPISTPALIGVGLIYEEEEEFGQAVDFLTRALERDPWNLRVRTEAAWVKALSGDYATGKKELGDCVPLLQKKGQTDKELLALTQYRLGSCIWHMDASKSARKSRDGAYSYFLASLKSNLNLAPAYTSLGIYYADYTKDKKRARRCFQKAVELSPSEVDAAERLARSFADEGDWDRVELVAKRIVDSGKVRPPPGSKRKGISWPFAALGVAQLNKQEYRQAIVSFQSALKLSPDDYHCWVGLGESYFSSGRYIAATKAILHAQTLEQTDPPRAVEDTWFTKYMLANVKRDVGDFDESIELYRNVSSIRPNEDGVILALMQTMAESAMDNLAKGVYGKAVQLALETIEFATTTELGIAEAFNFWKALGDACSIFSSVQSRVGEFPVGSIESLLKRCTSDADAILSEVDKVGSDVILAKGIFPDDEMAGVDLTRCIHTAILCHKRAIHVSAKDMHAQAVAYYNLGWVEHRAHTCLPVQLRKKSSRYLRAAIRAFKRAIELESGNSEFWNSLGVVTSQVNAKVAQHAFVRSLYLNERSPATWSNLGALALVHHDLQLANEAFTRAQSTDPDYAPAWLGQGFVALLYGDPKEARGLFTHAMEISESNCLPIRQQYALSVFDYLLTAPSDMGAAELIQPLYALAQAKALNRRDLVYRHMYTLFQERIGDFDKSLPELETICSSLESDYEMTESPVSLGRFALAKVDIARSYLASGKYDDAVECGDMALGLTSDEAENELPRDQRKKARLSAHLTVGLAQYFKQDVAESITCFESALKESDGNPDAVCLLAQVLWAIGTEASRDKAREALFGIVADDASHVQSVLLLGVVALLDNDDESLDAVASELHSLRISDRLPDTEHPRVGRVLRAIDTLRPGRTDEDVLSQIQTDVMLYPNLPHGWTALAERSGDEYPAQMAVKVALSGIPPRGGLHAEDLARAFSGTGRPADAQVAVFVAPWNAEGWKALDEAVEMALQG